MCRREWPGLAEVSRPFFLTSTDPDFAAGTATVDGSTLLTAAHVVPQFEKNGVRPLRHVDRHSTLRRALCGADSLGLSQPTAPSPPPSSSRDWPGEHCGVFRVEMMYLLLLLSSDLRSSARRSSSRLCRLPRRPPHPPPPSPPAPPPLPPQPDASRRNVAEDYLAFGEMMGEGPLTVRNQLRANGDGAADVVAEAAGRRAAERERARSEGGREDAYGEFAALLGGGLVPARGGAGSSSSAAAPAQISSRPPAARVSRSLAKAREAAGAGPAGGPGGASSSMDELRRQRERSGGAYGVPGAPVRAPGARSSPTHPEAAARAQERLARNKGRRDRGGAGSRWTDETADGSRGDSLVARRRAMEAALADGKARPLADSLDLLLGAGAVSADERGDYTNRASRATSNPASRPEAPSLERLREFGGAGVKIGGDNRDAKRARAIQREREDQRRAREARNKGRTSSGARATGGAARATARPPPAAPGAAPAGGGRKGQGGWGRGEAPRRKEEDRAGGGRGGGARGGAARGSVPAAPEMALAPSRAPEPAAKPKPQQAPPKPPSSGPAASAAPRGPRLSRVGDAAPATAESALAGGVVVRADGDARACFLPVSGLATRRRAALMEGVRAALARDAAGLAGAGDDERRAASVRRLEEGVAGLVGVTFRVRVTAVEGGGRVLVEEVG